MERRRDQESMVQSGPAASKGRMSRFEGSTSLCVRPDVILVTPGRKGGPSDHIAVAEGLQPWMNCICVPASSMTSPFFSGTASPDTGEPFTVGRVLPSTCANT